MSILILVNEDPFHSLNYSHPKEIVQKLQIWHFILFHYVIFEFHYHLLINASKYHIININCATMKILVPLAYFTYNVASLGLFLKPLCEKCQFHCTMLLELVGADTRLFSTYTPCFYIFLLQILKVVEHRHPLLQILKVVKHRHPLEVRHLENADLTSSWNKFHPFYAANAINVLIVSSLATGAKISLKLTLGCWKCHFATNLDLFFCTEPSSLNLVL